jgi:hypothetical protein
MFTSGKAEALPAFRDARMRTPRKMKAWLVTWEWMGEHAKRNDKIAAILNCRLSVPRVKELVEFLYLTEYYTLSEKMAVAQRRKDNPYPARAETAARRPLISCGHNPHLLARLVEDLTVEYSPAGKDKTIAWKEPSGRFQRVVLE